jgi:hypothetical protein
VSHIGDAAALEIVAIALADVEREGTN